MKAIIISCSEGIRLRPVTCSIPKTMMPVMGRPVIEHTVRLLHRHSINNVTVAGDYLTDEIKKHFAFVNIEDMQIDFSHKNNLNDFFKEDDVIVINDSLLTDINFEQLISFHHASGADATVVTKHTSYSYEYGAVHIDKSSFVTSYNRCPDFCHESGTSFMGIAVIKKGTSLSDCSNLQTLMEKLTQNGSNIYAYTPDCYIKNISDFESYHRCCRDFMDKKIRLPFPCDEKSPSVWIDENATVMQGAVIVPPVYIGSGSVINKGARIEAYTQIGNDVTIDCYAGIKRSIIMDNSCISESASVRGAFIGKGCSLGVESAAYEGSVIGFGSKLGKRCIVRTSMHIWPDKYIDDESCVSENIVWENTCPHSLFYNGSAFGIINREITPEFAVSLGRAAATLLGDKIAVSCEGAGAGSMIKNALISGLQSGGSMTYDMGDQPLPITRSGIRFYSLSGGISLSTYTQNGLVYGSLDIINSLGASIENEDIRKLQLLMSSASTRKVNATSIAEAEFLFEYKLYYLKQLINSTSKKPLGAKLLIYSPSQWATELLKSAASDLKCSFTFSDASNRDEFSKQVTEGDYDMGAMCDYKCETLTLITKSGYALTEFDYCTLTSLIIMKSFHDALIYVPESAPESIEQLAKKHSAQVRRTKISPPYLMNELSKSDRKLFLHQFIYRFDAVGAIIILLDYLYTANISLDSLLSEIPPSNIVTTSVSCTKDEQPEVIQRLHLRHHINTNNESDAVKIDFENGWVLVVPDRDQSVIRVISHGYSKEYAQELADICTDDITRR